jgi:hypothetical protein
MGLRCHARGQRRAAGHRAGHAAQAEHAVHPAHERAPVAQFEFCGFGVDRHVEYAGDDAEGGQEAQQCGIAGHDQQAGEQQGVDGPAGASRRPCAVAADPPARLREAEQGAHAGCEHGQAEFSLRDAVLGFYGRDMHAPGGEDEARGEELRARCPARASRRLHDGGRHA